MLTSARTEPFDDLDRLSPASLDRWWAKKLKRVARLGFDELPFYRERFAAAGFDPTQFRTLDDLHAIPISKKEDLLSVTQNRGSKFLGIKSYTAGPDARMTVSLSSLSPDSVDTSTLRSSGRVFYGLTIVPRWKDTCRA